MIKGREQQAEGRYFSRDTDHLGFIEKQLKDLAGFATLTHELLQNADDARASRIEFHIDADALRIVNDGVFSDCQRQEESDCPWLVDEARRRRCDFHRLRRVASGDKRQEADTAGAFGVGFIAVYQITDRPEVASAGRHWVIDEVQEASQRIRQCSGCPTCRAADVPPTLFVLPWARQPDTPFRIRTRSTPLEPGDEGRLEGEIREALPTALLFLRHVSQAELWSNGTRLYRVARLVDGDNVLVEDGTETRLWHLLRGNFAEEATSIRARFPSGIEDKRRTDVTLAIPSVHGVHGLLCAYLPTQHRTGLPFHLNADFIPTSDRKRIQFEGETARAWNEAALQVAADALAQGLAVLQRELSPKVLWALFHDAHLARQAGDRGEADALFSEFWRRLEPVARNAAVAYTSDARWVVPRDAVHFAESLQESMRHDVERLGIPIVHPDLTPFFNTLGALGVVPLSRARYLAALHANLEHRNAARECTGAREATESDAAAERACWWQQEEALTRVWATFAALPEGGEKSQKEERELVRSLPLVVCRSGRLEALEDCWVADDELGDIVGRILADLPIAVSGQPYESQLARYGDRLQVDTLIGQLEHSAEALPDAFARDPDALRELLQWFAGHRAVLNAKPDLSATMRSLPIVPSAGTVRPLDELSLPGDFTDELGIAGVVDLEAAGEVRDLLHALGAAPLTIADYAREHVPLAFARAEVSEATRRSVVSLLAGRLGELRDVVGVQEALAETSIVECEDGSWRVPGAAYVRTEAVVAALGDEAGYARLPDHTASAVRELFEWLGVRESPRPGDVVDAIATLCRQAPDEGARRRMGQLAAALIAPFDAGTLSADLLARLKLLAWLPGKREQAKWHRPDAVYTVFQEYLFGTQAEFLDMPREVQQQGTKVLSALGVRDAPSSVQVAQHVLACARTRAPANPEVYRVLARAVAENGGTDVVRLLRDQPSIQIEPGRFLAPRHVVWGAHPFGARRATLDVSWRPHQALLDALGVRVAVDASDALDVLRTSAQEYGTTNRLVLEAECLVIHSAWQVITKALEAGTIAESEVEALQSARVVVSPAGHLVEPTALLFADRSDLAERFDDFRQFFITRDSTTWYGLRVACVRPLWKAVYARLVLSDDAADDLELRARLRSRYAALLQVASATLPPVQVARSLEALLRALCCTVASRLELRLELELSGKRFERPAITVPAAWDAERGTLAWTGSHTGRSWAAVARELALALDPEGDRTGPLASGFKEALSASSLEDAHDALEELGYPRITMEIPLWGAVAAGQLERPSAGAKEPEPRLPIESVDPRAEERPRTTATEAGQERPLRSGARSSSARPDRGRSAAEQQAERDPSLSTERTEPASDVADGRIASGAIDAELAEETLDQARRVGADWSANVVASTEDDGGQIASGSVARPARPQRRYLATVYTEPSTEVRSGGAAAEEGRDVWGARLETDAAGMQLVLEHERRAGRIPVEMPHANPGYDVESFSVDGDLLRYIEVKSTVEPWGIRGVALRPIQLQHAKEQRERYWLYVVELAGREEARVLRIQDPYGHIEQFAFDNTWRPFSEDDHESLRA